MPQHHKIAYYPRMLGNTSSSTTAGAVSASETKDVHHSSWTRQLEGEDGKDVSYNAIIIIRPNEGIQISLSDHRDSYEANLTIKELLDLCDKPTIAHVDPAQRISRIQTALRSDDKGTTRVVRNGDNLELRISAPWGSEFGDLSIKLDIAEIPLQRHGGTESFVSSAFERIGTYRAQAADLRNQRQELELEVEELWEAKKILDEMTREEDKRMQVFADALNEYKRLVRAASAE